MAENKTAATKVSVKDFIAGVENETRRKDAQVLLKLFQKVTGWKPQMWGPTIVGFGRYDYVYDSGHGGAICVAGFSPRKANLVFYVRTDDARGAALLGRLGKYKKGKGCLYLNKLADVDMGVLEQLIANGVAVMKADAAKRGWPVSAT